MAFAVVREFERRVAEFARAQHGVAVSTGTAAIFLALKYQQAHGYTARTVTLPAHTFISVPQMVMACGLNVEFKDVAWKGTYELNPFGIVDGALRFKRGMYGGGLHCLSFQARKHLNIGEGGMILTNSESAAEWLRAAAYCGRKPPHYRVEDVDMEGWNLYMTPEKAARGLHLLEYAGDGWPDQVVGYPDLRKVKYFELHRRNLLRAA